MTKVVLGVELSSDCCDMTSQLVHREEDGAVRFDDLTSTLMSEFDGTSHWRIRAWISFLINGGEQKKRFQSCLNFVRAPAVCGP